MDCAIAHLFSKIITQGRDHSHGYEHMQAVAHRAIAIAREEKYSEDDCTLVEIVAVLHDVADPKYDPTGQLRLRLAGFLAAVYTDTATLILAIIDRVSYSREVAHGTDDWDRVLGDRGVRVRNVVSDADKLEALGRIGFERVVEYTRVRLQTANPDDIILHVSEHCNSKLYHLPRYIRTRSGRAAGATAAAELHDLVEAGLGAPR